MCVCLYPHYRKETEVTQLQAASDLLQQQLMNMETQYHEKMEEQRHKNVNNLFVYVIMSLASVCV